MQLYLAKESAWFGPFSKRSPKSTVYTQSRFLHLRPRLCFLEYDFWGIFVRFLIRLPLCTFLDKKTAWFGLCSNSCSKSTVSIFIFEAEILYFEVLIFDEFFFDSSSEHHCVTFLLKLLDFSFFRNFAPQCTANWLSPFVLLRPKKLFLKYDLLANFCSMLHHSTMVHII